MKLTKKTTDSGSMSKNKLLIEKTESCNASVSSAAPNVFANVELNNDKPKPDVMTGNIFNDIQLAQGKKTFK
jgi:hypothetical protein